MIYVLDTNVIIHYLKENENVKLNLRQAVTNGCELIVPRAVDYEICRGLELLAATACIATRLRAMPGFQGRNSVGVLRNARL